METTLNSKAESLSRYVISTLRQSPTRLLTPKETQNKIYKNPEWFVDKILGCPFYWDMQINLIERVRDNQQAAVYGCTGSTKTYAAAMLMAWWMASSNHGRVFTIAPVFRQVETNIWGYFRTIYREAKIPLGGRLYETPEWVMEPE